MVKLRSAEFNLIQGRVNEFQYTNGGLELIQKHLQFIIKGGKIEYMSRNASTYVDETEGAYREVI